MCYTLTHLHSHCPHIQSNEIIPCVTFPALGKCFSTNPQVHEEVGDIPFCTGCFQQRAEVQFWLAIAEAEFKKETEAKCPSDVRVEKEVQVWRGGVVGRLVGWESR